MKIYTILMIIFMVFMSSCSSYKYDKRDHWINHKYSNLSYIDTSAIAKQTKNHIINASIYKIKEDYAMAIIEYEMALRYDTTASILYAIAKCFSHLKIYDYARDYAIRTLNKDPSFLPVYETLCRAYLGVNDIKNAILTLENVLTIMGDDEEYTLYLARLYEYENIDKAKVYYCNLITKYSNDEAYNRLIDIYQEDKDTTNYFNLVREYWKKYPFDYSIAVNAMQFSFEMKHYNKIFDNIDLIDTNFSISELENIYSWCIVKMTELVKSNPTAFNNDNISTIVSKIDERFNNSILININVGELLLAFDKNITRANKYLQNVINTPDLDAALYIRCSTAYYDYGYKELAIATLTKAIEFTPQDKTLIEKRKMLEASEYNLK